MRALETYQSNAAEAPVMRKWFFFALILSLLFHAGLLLCFKSAKLERFSEGPAEQRLVPMPFHATRVDIPEKLLEPEKEPAQPTVEMPAAVKNIETPPEEKPFEDLRATPAAEQPLKQIVPADDKPDMSKLQSTKQMEQRVSRSMDQEIDPALRNQLIKDNPKLTKAPKLRLKDFGASGGVPEGFQSIDQALNASGTKNAKTGPILMPTDLLFDYDSADLRSGAVTSLEKLGKLILSNPHAAFGIEGHTDSFGTPEYNQSLSLRRAESVKQWLVASMGIQASRIQTKGFGSTKLIAPAGRSVEEQQINRRVEIVIHQHPAKTAE